MYVDDIVLEAMNKRQLNEVKQSPAKHFNIKDMGRLQYFLRMLIIHNDKTNEVWIGQPTYTDNLIWKFDMENTKPMKTPVDTSIKLVKATEGEERKCTNQ